MNANSTIPKHLHSPELLKQDSLLAGVHAENAHDDAANHASDLHFDSFLFKSVEHLEHINKRVSGTLE